jgi:aryl-alcohol dehydrogenase-like predicted oxidoreductase
MEINMQKVILRRSGLQVSKLGIGTGTHGWNGSSEQTRIGFSQLVALLRLAYDQGITFWDTAEAYGSHKHIAEAIKGIDRSSVTIMTKTFSKQSDQVQIGIQNYLKELGTDYIDILLMHCITQRDWLIAYADVIDTLKKAKEKGMVKAIGMSCHDFEALKTVASADWIDVVFARINYNGTHMDAKPDDIVPELEKIYNAGKDVIGMKIIGQGQLNSNTEKAFEYALALNCVDSVIVGMSNEAQVTQNVAFVNKYFGK